jgi:hypothetical protein
MDEFLEEPESVPRITQSMWITPIAITFGIGSMVVAVGTLGGVLALAGLVDATLTRACRFLSVATDP